MPLFLQEQHSSNSVSKCAPPLLHLSAWVMLLCGFPETNVAARSCAVWLHVIMYDAFTLQGDKSPFRSWRKRMQYFPTANDTILVTDFYKILTLHVFHLSQCGCRWGKYHGQLPLKSCVTLTQLAAFSLLCALSIPAAHVSAHSTISVTQKRGYFSEIKCSLWGRV